MLEGTRGLLHVGCVYIEEYQFRDLWLRFEDGRVTDYGCGNFKPQENWEEQGKALVEAGDFPGPRPAANGRIRHWDQYHSLRHGREIPDWGQTAILIAEKTGPHFAVGDTCYSFSEDSPMYNPDGKEVIAGITRFLF